MTSSPVGPRDHRTGTGHRLDPLDAWINIASENKSSVLPSLVNSSLSCSSRTYNRRKSATAIASRILVRSPTGIEEDYDL